jgi:hypothetical protein
LPGNVLVIVVKVAYSSTLKLASQVETVIPLTVQRDGGIRIELIIIVSEAPESI